MNGRPVLAAIAWLALVTGPAAATDLTKIDRSILKEPVYQSKQPQYCLLVFGPEAKIRVWLVLDGDVLYVDRKGNGDSPPRPTAFPPYVHCTAPRSGRTSRCCAILLFPYEGSTTPRSPPNRYSPVCPK